MVIKTIKLFVEFIFVALLVAIVGVSILSKTTRTVAGYTALVVTSGSMEPTVKTGSLLIVKTAKPGDINKGDIITFKSPRELNQLVTHRVSEVIAKPNGTKLYKTKGDANNTIDIWELGGDLVVGKTQYVIPYIGFVVNFIKTPLGFIVFVVLPALAIIGLELINVKKALEEEVTKRSQSQGKQETSGMHIVEKITAFLLLTTIVASFHISSTQADFSSAGGNPSSAFASACWVSPSTPLQTFPANDTNTNATNIVFTWDASTSSCASATLTYNFQIFSDVGLTSLVAESGFSGSLSYLYTSIPEGEYWWRVQVQDQFSNAAASGGFHLIVDRTAPAVTLSVTGSGYKAVTENVTNGDFETGTLSGWNTAGTVARVGNDAIATASGTVVPVDGTSMARLGSKTASTTTNGNYVWSNRLMQSFATGAKSLSLYYNVYTRDYAPNDDPGFFIRINGQEVFRANTLAPNPTSATDNAAYSTGWQQFTYNLAEMTSSDVNLAIYAGNTGDLKRQTWAYVDKITTYFVSAKGSADYKIAATDAVSGVNQCFYQVDSGGYTAIANGSTFQITTDGTHSLSYYCSDNAGNTSAVTPATVITDSTAPAAISDLAVSTTSNTAVLTWTAPGNDGSTGRASTYDVRYSTSAITDDASFNSATQVSNVPSPQTNGTAESLTITGLDSSTLYYFAIKSSDEGPNTSSLSNIVSGTTAAGSTVNVGDVVINELMWMGSSAATTDEWIELRNTTSHTIDLSSFVLTRWNGTSDVTMVTIASGKTIAAGGYFLISNFDSNASQISDSISVDVVNTAVNLSNTALSIKLKDASSNLIDSAWDQTAPKEGVHNAGSSLYYSMERTSVPGDGTNPLSWYTCIDEASTTDFFDSGAVERGTPKGANRSENEPLSYQKFYPTYPETAVDEEDATESAVLEASPTPAATETATPTPTASDAATPTPTETVSPTPTVPADENATPSGEQATPTPTGEPSPSVEATPTPSVSESPTSTIEPTATETQAPVATDTVSPTTTPLRSEGASEGQAQAPASTTAPTEQTTPQPESTTTETSAPIQTQ